MSTPEYLRVMEEGPLPSLQIPKPYKCVVVIEAEVSPRRQSQISLWLVETGCRYMMAWGPRCSSWDDSVDLANIEQFEFNDIPDDGLVMTTCHESETLQEVFEFSRHNVAEIQPMLVLQIGGGDRRDELLEMIGNA